MAYLLSLLLLVSAGSTAASKPKVLERAIAVDPLCARANPENVHVAPLYRGIQIVHIPHGLNRDPVPKPRRLFLLPNGRVVPELAEALKRRKITATDDASALELATHLVEQDEYYNGGGSVVTDAEMLARLPEDWRAKVALPEVTAQPKKAFRVVAYLYRPAMTNRFGERPAALVRYQVDINGFTYERTRERLVPRYLPGDVPRGAAHPADTR